MPPGPPSPASTPTKRNTSSSGAPKRSAIRLDSMPASTSRLPSRMAILIVSSEAMRESLAVYSRGSRRTISENSSRSKRHLISALERKNLARLVGRRDLVAKAFENLAHLRDLLGVRLGEPAGADPERILHADAHVAAHRRRHGGNPHLALPGAEHRPVIVVAQKPVGGTLHHHHVFRMRADAAQDAEHRLHEHRRLDKAAV